MHCWKGTWLGLEVFLVVKAGFQVGGAGWHCCGVSIFGSFDCVVVGVVGTGGLTDFRDRWSVSGPLDHVRASVSVCYIVGPRVLLAFKSVSLFRPLFQQIFELLNKVSLFFSLLAE